MYFQQISCVLTIFFEFAMRSSFKSTQPKRAICYFLKLVRFSNSKKNHQSARVNLISAEWRPILKAPKYWTLQGKNHDPTKSTLKYFKNMALHTCPCMFIITTVLVLLHTTILSGFFGSKWTELTLTLPPAEAPIDLNVFKHSVVLVFHSLTVPSLEALISWCPSNVEIMLFTYEVCPRNSFKVLPKKYKELDK